MSSYKCGTLRVCILLYFPLFHSSSLILACSLQDKRDLEPWCDYTREAPEAFFSSTLLPTRMYVPLATRWKHAPLFDVYVFCCKDCVHAWVLTEFTVDVFLPG